MNLKRNLIIFLITSLFFTGCKSKAQNRAELVAWFHTTFPDTWQEKLKEYETKQYYLLKKKIYETRKMDFISENTSAYIIHVYE